MDQRNYVVALIYNNYYMSGKWFELILAMYSTVGMRSILILGKYLIYVCCLHLMSFYTLKITEEKI